MSASESRPKPQAHPVIGLSTYSEPAQMLFWSDRFAMLHQSYVDAVSRAGGSVVLLPPQPSGAAEVVARLDGLILTGGADLDPAGYGQPSHERTGVPRADRDTWELELLDAALHDGLPLLGICRGMQLLNVALGGSLHQHVPDVVEHTAHQPQLGSFGTTRVRLSPGSRVASLLGPEAEVSCHHHQALDTVADGLDVTGRSPDGLIEAVESTSSAFVVAVQWHPEQEQRDARLFEGLVRAAREGGRRSLKEGVA